ncbi:hypothetical protein [Rhizobium rhizogenes]|uniref:RiboL-PSP-HEPN domain-containing protein n=1 Tax=Rhizobium rhizogenes (strain K84 / ATCC BAA-868) TaxID=311403 RepID=B9JF57_RHIR8|nr:conserved hypothetical protein [Rhizobium rhizogenes K84]
MEENKPRKQGFVVDAGNMPKLYPTHLHKPSFWESLGRAVATFGLLEDALARAIFAFTGTRQYSESEVEKAFGKWIAGLEKTLSDTLRPLIEKYASAVKAHPDAHVENFDDLVLHLKNASEIRNAICHGAWGAPNSQGFSELRYFAKTGEKFETPIDEKFLLTLQCHVAELISHVISSVTHMGWQFPGSSGPGDPIVKV